MTTATINGTGECGRIRITFGDGWIAELSSIKTWPQYVEHRYSLASVSLGEVQENVKAEGIQDCSGVISTRLFVNASLPVTRPINMIQGIRPIFPAGSADIQLDQPVSFVVTGLGSCTKLRVDWGDGTPPKDAANVALYTNPTYSHVFTGWGGGKTVTAIGVEGCSGRVNTRFRIQPEVFVLGYNAGGPMVCNAVAQPSLVVPTLVHVTTTPVTFDSPDIAGHHFLSGIDFGCPFHGCVYDANGKPDSVAASPFPFLGKREYSLVFKVGTVVVQGGTNVQFTTKEAGPLMLCLNDNDLSDDIGGLVIRITVHQLGPPPPQ